MIATKYCKNVFDGTHDTPKPSDKGTHKLLTSKNILMGAIDKTDAYYISDEDYEAINKRSKVHQWDVLFSMIGTVGNVCIVDIPDDEIDFAIKNMGCFSCGDEKKAKWLYYFLQSPYARKLISNELNGAIQKFLPLGWLRNLDIPEYTLETNWIIDVLDNIDRKIILNNSICIDLESMAKLLYDYWFVQFDFPDENGKPYKSSGGKMVYNEELKREIPEGWEVVNLKGRYQIERGISYTSKDIESGKGVAMLNLACVDRDRNYRDGELKYYAGKLSDTDMVKPFDLMIACTDLTREREIIGCPILVPADENDYTYSMDMAKIHFTDDNIEDLYMYAALRTTFYHEYIKQWASGTNVLHLNLEGLDWYNTYIPNISLQKKYAELIRNIHAEKSKMLSENRQLTELRDFLLPMLMNGQIKIGA